MSLADKIEEIRQKPERERVKYVWFMVSISMVFVIFVWFFSFKASFQGSERINSGEDTITELEKNPETNADNSENAVSQNVEQGGEMENKSN